MDNDESKLFNMPMPDLAQFSINISNTMRADSGEFAQRGIDLADIDALETLANEFLIFPNDAFYLSLWTLAVEKKNELRTNIEKMLREMVAIASVKWGEGSAQSKRFDLSKMTKVGDKVFLSLAILALPVAADFLTELSEYGLTQGKIDLLSAEIDTLKTAMAAMAEAAMTRELKTAERLSKGNELYKLTAKYCEIGKIIWQDRDYVKYTFYLIYK